MAKTTARKYRVIDGPIKSHDTEYEVGDTIELTDKEAKGLSQFVDLIKETKSADSGKSGSEK
ncbi:MAG: hypothetical protein LCH54_15575 [Bacteroidetes bacterium]|nr:hypothetical protein [Bacteroidota bacterium]